MLKKLLVVFLFINTLSVSALKPAIPVDTCTQINVMGDPHWSPYVINNEGVSVDLAKEIFKELGIPVKFLPYKNKRGLWHGLQLGDIDLILVSYDYPEIKNLVDLIHPGFYYDPITIAVRKDSDIVANSFEDLTGKRGVVTTGFDFDEYFADFSKKYLYIHQKGNLEDVIKMVFKRQADYVIGSKEQLEYGIKQQKLEKTLKIINVYTNSDVYMGFSKRSHCRSYASYVTKRLQELNKNGEIDTLLSKYKNKLTPKKSEEYDYLFKLKD